MEASYDGDWCESSPGLLDSYSHILFNIALFCVSSKKTSALSSQYMDWITVYMELIFMGDAVFLSGRLNFQ